MKNIEDELTDALLDIYKRAGDDQQTAKTVK